MSAFEASEDLINLVRVNSDIANFADGVSASDLAAAEREIGVAFPPSYRRVVEEFGTFDIAGEEFLGVYRTPAMGDRLLGSVSETLDAQSKYGMPSETIAVMLDGMGGIVILDSTKMDTDQEYPVFVWNPGVVDRDDMERVGHDFGTFALELSKRAVSRWRASA